MDKTMYEVHWHWIAEEEDKFSHCTVTPIEVLREGILPGCSGVSITAKGSDGRVFLGVPRDYFESEEAAWADIRQVLQDSIESNDAEISRIQGETRAMFMFLMKISKD